MFGWLCPTGLHILLTGVSNSMSDLSDKATNIAWCPPGLTVGSGMFDLLHKTAKSFTVIYPMIPMAA